MTYLLPDKRNLLANNIFFRGITAEELDKILSFSSENHYSNGQIIFQKGDFGDSLLAVLDGKVRISTSSDDGKEIILNTTFRGEIFGEIAFIDGMQRSATATAIGETTLLTIRSGDFLPFLKKNPDIAIHWLKVLCKKLRDTNDRVEVLGLLPVSVSLARLLIKAAEITGEETPEGVYLDWKKSQQDIANEIGTTRESVNRQFNKWKKQGLVSLGGQSLSITILDSDTLEDIASGYE
ncbi:MAG: Crp/Fnr family transcriptional regulator [Methylococcales bacterium]